MIYSAHNYASIKRIIEEHNTGKYFLIQWCQGKPTGVRVMDEEGNVDGLPSWVEIL